MKVYQLTIKHRYKPDRPHEYIARTKKGAYAYAKRYAGKQLKNYKKYWRMIER